jgi:hypothetical protein
MSEPSLELQGAILTALKADAGVDALIADRIYDKVPPAPTFPYVTISDDQVVSAHADCLDNSTQVFSTLHAWSRAGGKVEVKRVSGAVVKALNFAQLPLGGGFRLVLLEHDSTQFLVDPDGLTTHSVIVFHAFVDET